MKKAARTPVRFVVLCALLPLLLALPPRALAQEATEWKGYAVIAQDTDGTLCGAVVRNPDTGGRALVIGDMQNGAFTLAARCEAAIPADWADGDLTVDADNGKETNQYPSVTVRVPTDDSHSLYYVTFMLRNGSWQLRQLRGQYESTVYSLYPMADGSWEADDMAACRIAVLPGEALGGTMETFAFEQSVRTAAEAIRTKYERQAETIRGMLQAAFPGTPLAEGMPVTWTFSYNEDLLLAAAAAVRVGTEAVLCLWTPADDGAWNAAANWHTLAADVSAESLWMNLGYDDSGETLVLSLNDRAAADMAELGFQLDADGGWTALYYSFTNDQGDFWNANRNGSLWRVFAGGFIAEEGYLYWPEDPAQTAFAAFDSAQMKREMLTLYDDFMAGEPPMIPGGSSAYALPQPCGATLTKGTYAVYTGPGRQYAREADGKAAVSTADWVQVFGTDGDWVLIQYRVQGALLRFGYIETSALQNPAAVPALTLESVLLENTDNEFVTSNPLGLGGRLRFDYSGVSMTRLGTLGDFWMYVELTLPNGKPARMFAEISPSHG